MKFRCLYTCTFIAIFMNRSSQRRPIADTAQGVEEGQTAHGQGKDAEEGLEKLSASRHKGFWWSEGHGNGRIEREREREISGEAMQTCTYGIPVTLATDRTSPSSPLMVVCLYGSWHHTMEMCRWQAFASPERGAMMCVCPWRSSTPLEPTSCCRSSLCNHWPRCSEHGNIQSSIPSDSSEFVRG